MSEWQDISTAPKDGTKVDMWFKWWRADTDVFLGTRVPDCHWRFDLPNPGWYCDWGGNGIPINSRPTHWMARPDDPPIRSTMP